MKKYLLAVTLAALAASPALAASKHRTDARSSYAYAGESAYAAGTSDAVIVNGKYLGADPDPAVRRDLVRQGDPATAAGF